MPCIDQSGGRVTVQDISTSLPSAREINQPKVWWPYTNVWARFVAQVRKCDGCSLWESGPGMQFAALGRYRDLEGRKLSPLAQFFIEWLARLNPAGDD